MDRLAIEVAENVSLSVLRWGSDGPLPPVLLVHGLASNAHLWDGVAEILAGGGHQVAAVDLRGHGRSSKPDDGYDFGTITADLRRLVDSLGWAGRVPVVAGQSWGGNVVLELAARHPAATAGLVLVDGGTIDLSSRFADWPTCEAALTPPPLAGMRASEFEKLIRTHHPEWPETGIDGTLANMEVLGDGTVRPWLRRENHLRILHHLWEHHPRDTYPSVSVPVLIVMADDSANPRWMAAKRDEASCAARLLPRASVQWIEGDHDLHAQHPALVAGLIEQLAGSAP
ncbi:MAG: alpha/beta hydrolase [Acidimicrobiales bacterium]|nr:alpha/beta hydrolase [Acidimicrobiales bacterium]